MKLGILLIEFITMKIERKTIFQLGVIKFSFKSHYILNCYFHDDNDQVSNCF